MDITLTGTGTPIPLPERNGMSIHIGNADDQLLVDCGPGTVHSLVEHGIDPTEIEKLFFTHHHMDHNADFFHFAIGTWVVGRTALSLWGPTGTDDLLDGLYSAFKQDLQARETVGNRSQSGLNDIDATTVSGGATVELPHWTVEALTVDHVGGLETLAYRVEETATGDIVVYSGDTTPVEEMADFARDANILVHDCTLAPYIGETPDNEVVWNEFTEIDEDFYSHLSEIHSTPRQAGEIAAEAGVEMLVLTHILPYRDEAGMVAAASEWFDGNIHLGTDGVQISTE